MLQKEKIEPRKLGYDRPSPKFINFLNKYFGLKYYVPQNNNFVVFKDYFIDEPRKKDKYDIYNNFPNINKKIIIILKEIMKNPIIIMITLMKIKLIIILMKRKNIFKMIEIFAQKYMKNIVIIIKIKILQK